MPACLPASYAYGTYTRAMLLRLPNHVRAYVLVEVRVLPMIHEETISEKHWEERTPERPRGRNSRWGSRQEFPSR